MSKHEVNFTEIARVIGEPIDPNLKVPFIISEIANVEVAEAGEEVKYYASYDANVDDIYTADAAGQLTRHKLTASSATALTFVGLQSKLEHVLLQDVLAGSEGNKPDTGVLGRKKAAIARGMDKEEARRICAACLALSGQEVTQGSGEDIYTLIKNLIRKVEDYGDNYVLLVGTTVKKAMEDYSKDKATSHYYDVDLDELLAKKNVKVIKVFGTFTNSTGTGQRILAVDKLILVARDSTIAAGKPILFIRRKINPDTAEYLGLEAGAERLVVKAQLPNITDGTANLLAYGVCGYESIIEAITNSYAISWATYA